MDKKDLQRSVFNLLLINSQLTVRVLDKKILKKYKLSYPKFLILNMLIKRGEPLKSSYFAEKMNVSNANITGLIQRMKKDSLLTKKSDKLDKRASFIDITPFGKKLYEQVLPEFLEYTAKHLGEATEEEMLNMLNMQKKLYASLLEDN